MIDFAQFIRPENIPSLIMSFLALCVAIASVVFTYKNYKINEGAAWHLRKINDVTWQLERNHRQLVVLIGLATIPSWLGYKISPVGPYPKFYGKGDTITFKVSSSTTLGSLEDIMLCVFFRPFFSKDSIVIVIMKTLLEKFWNMMNPVMTF